ncbi:hypothetical protein ACFPRL_06730 [Pseudoclavibacter helvolus]
MAPVRHRPARGPHPATRQPESRDRHCPLRHRAIVRLIHVAGRRTQSHIHRAAHAWQPRLPRNRGDRLLRALGRRSQSHLLGEPAAAGALHRAHRSATAASLGARLPSQRVDARPCPRPSQRSRTSRCLRCRSPRSGAASLDRYLGREVPHRATRSHLHFPYRRRPRARVLGARLRPEMGTPLRHP